MRPYGPKFRIKANNEKLYSKWFGRRRLLALRHLQKNFIFLRNFFQKKYKNYLISKKILE